MKRYIFLLIPMVFWTNIVMAQYEVRNLVGNSYQRQVVFESFLNAPCGNCQNAGLAIKFLAKEYNDNNKPVLFLEQYVHSGTPAYAIRYSRWWTAYGISGPAAYPMVMVDSGNQISNGPVNYSGVYASMVDAALLRPPACSIKATSQRIVNHFHFDIRITNLSGSTLSFSNTATIHAMLYEINAINAIPGIVGVTGTYVRAGAQLWISSLANGATGTFSLDTPDLTGVENWQNVHSLVIVEYRPSAEGAYDTLQVAFEVQGQVVNRIPGGILQLLLLD